MLTTFRYERVSTACVGSVVAVQVVYLVSRACQLFIEVDVHLSLCFCCFLLLVLHYHMNGLASKVVSRSDHDTWSLTDSFLE